MGSLIPGMPDDIARECLARVHYTHFRVVKSVSNLWKSELSSSAFHQFRKSNGLTRPVVALTQSESGSLGAGPAYKYALAPVYRLVLFEPDTGSWHALPPLPSVSFSHSLPFFCQIAGTSRELIVIGGWDPDTWMALDSVFIYDLLTGTWREGARLPAPQRSFFGCASSDKDRMVFVAGGHDEDKNALRSALAYDIERDLWVELPQMARERDECKGVFADGKFHVVGGYGTEMQGRFGRCSEAFDVSTWRWGPVEEETLEVGTCPRTCVAGVDGKLYRCRAGKVAVKEEGKEEWRDVAVVPKDAVVGIEMVRWQGKLTVIGGNGGSKVVYVLKEEWEWDKVEVPLEYSGQIQALCSLEI